MRGEDTASFQGFPLTLPSPVAQSLTAAGVEKITEVEGVYLGVEVAELTAEVERCLREDGGEFPRIELRFEKKNLTTGGR